MKRTLRATFACFLFTTLFVAGSGVAFFTCTSAQDADPAKSNETPAAEEKTKPQPTNEEEAENPESEGGETDEGEENKDDSFAPRGPDELFTPLPGENLYQGTVPDTIYKAAIVRIPNQDSWNDRPDDDLGSNERYQAGGFVLLLEQMIDYLPQVYLEPNRGRMHRHGAKLRKGDVPRAGTPDVEGKVSVALDRTLQTFGADIVFALSFVPGEGEQPAKGACYRYEPDGVTASVEWTFGTLGKPEDDSQFRYLNEKVEQLCNDIGATTNEAGETVTVPHAPIPPMVTSDKALRDFVKMRDALDNGQITKAYLAWLALLKRDPRCGRGALYGMEVYRALADQATTPEESAKFMHESIKTGREALKHTPNDVALRGRLCWNGASNYNRREWAQEGLKQAMQIQPANTALFDWWVMAYAFDDALKQAEWLEENALPKVKNGRVELSLGNIYYNAGEYQKAIEWYKKAIEKMPYEHEVHLSLGLCATYEGERLSKFGSRRAPLAYATASDALWQAIMIDPQEVAWAYEYYVRAKTRTYTYLPSNPEELDNLFLVQAAVNGLEPTSRTFQWERLVEDLVVNMRRTLREDVRSVTPDDELFTLKLLARIQFARVDDDSDDLIHTLWLMREHGLRPDAYHNGMARLGPLVEDYKPPEEEGESKDEPGEDPAEDEAEAPSEEESVPVD